MSIITPTQKCKAFCNLLALGKGLDPGGHATPFETLLLLEAPLPWGRDMYTTPGALPQEVIELYAFYVERYRQTGFWPALYLFLIAPDEAYSQPGRRRVILFERDGDQMANFARTEYLVPEAEAGPLVWTLAEEPEGAGRFDAWKTADIPTNPTRDILVCTHGSVDAACAKFGFPLYRYMRRTHAADNLRVWRVSHFGGHVFAPTLMEMPSGHFWAYVGEAQADQIVQRNGLPADLRGHYRGWAGLANGFLQAAERELWLREGWRWFDWPRRGEVLAEGGAGASSWADVCFVVEKNGRQHHYKARVEMQGSIDTIHTTNNEETLSYPQYRVCWIEHLSRQKPGIKTFA